MNHRSIHPNPQRAAARSHSRHPQPALRRPSSSPATKHNDLRVSSRGLDMCLLAVCSCALSLMCHQTSGLLNMPSVNASSGASHTSSAPAQVDFMVKAGLVTTRDKAAEEEEA